jgi:hypothetical protein
MCSGLVLTNSKIYQINGHGVCIMARSNLPVQHHVTPILATNPIAQAGTTKQVSSTSNMFDSFLDPPPKKKTKTS